MVDLEALATDGGSVVQDLQVAIEGVRCCSRPIPDHIADAPFVMRLSYAGGEVGSPDVTKLRLHSVTCTGADSHPELECGGCMGGVYSFSMVSTESGSM